MRPSGDPPRVLLLDTEAGRRRSLARFLRDQGYDVGEAALVAEGLALAADSHPAALVLAQRVRDGSALDLVEELVARPRPFVVVHGDWSPGALPVPPHGVDVYLPHPLRAGDVGLLLGEVVPIARCRELPHVRPGEHLLLAYTSTGALLDSLAAVFAPALQAGERCVLECPDAALANAARAHFDRVGIDVERRERAHALAFVSRDETYFVNGRFDPRATLALIADLAQNARDDGFTGLRCAGEGSWIPETPEDRDAWFRYEDQVTPLATAHGVVVICLYSLDRFEPDGMLDALRTHPLLLDGRAVCSNAYYREPGRTSLLPPEVALKSRLAAIRRLRREAS